MKYTPPDFGEADDISRGKSSRREFFKNSLSVVIVIGITLLALGLFSELVVRYIPDSWEASLGKHLPTLPAHEKSSQQQQRAQRILDKLLQSNELRKLNYQLSLITLDPPNALAVPGGSIYLSHSLLENVKTETGLAMVIAHELGHHHHRHSLNRLGRSFVYKLFASILFNDTFATLGDFTSQIALLSFNREQELEADVFGWTATKKAFGHTKNVGEFFEMMQKKGLGPKKWQAFLATHPLTEDRIEQLKNLD